MFQELLSFFSSSSAMAISGFVIAFFYFIKYFRYEAMKPHERLGLCAALGLVASVPFEFIAMFFDPFLRSAIPIVAFGVCAMQIYHDVYLPMFF
jgi:hypothetical protein